MRLFILCLLLTSTTRAFAGPGDGALSKQSYDWLMKPVPADTSEAHHMQLVETLLKMQKRREAAKASGRAAERIWVEGNDAPTLKLDQPKLPGRPQKRTRSIDQMVQQLWVGPRV